MNKHRRKGRAIDHTWRFVKYQVDNAIYAKCSCGFKYPCYKNTYPNGFKITIAPDRLYPYCPYCGAKKKRYIEVVENIDKTPWE